MHLLTLLAVSVLFHFPMAELSVANSSEVLGYFPSSSRIFLLVAGTELGDPSLLCLWRVDPWYFYCLVLNHRLSKIFSVSIGCDDGWMGSNFSRTTGCSSVRLIKFETQSSIITSDTLKLSKLPLLPLGPPSWISGSIVVVVCSNAGNFLGSAWGRGRGVSWSSRVGQIRPNIRLMADNGSGS